MAFQPEKDLTCPVCHDFFKLPVVLTCSHSFCTECLRSWWRQKPAQNCPVCKRTCPTSDPPLNLALKNLCESYLQQQDHVCRLHSEAFKLFCVSDRQLVCVVCRDSAAHRKHAVIPVDEATKVCKDELQKALNPLKDRLELVMRFRKYCEFSTDHIKTQHYRTANLIREEFLKLHNFLSQQQEARLKALKEEEERKTQKMKDRISVVSKEIEALSEIIEATEEQLRSEDVSFLIKYKAAVEKVQNCALQEEPQLSPGALVDQAKHLGNLTYHVWSSMKTLVNYCPVILDPNTAHPEVVLSDDLTSFTCKEEQKLPLNPERVPVGLKAMVRGHAGLDSGSHSWDVDVGDSDEWELGVVTLSAFSVSPDDEYFADDAGWWSVEFSDDKYTAVNIDKKKDMVLKLKSNPRRVRVLLECSKRKLTFSDADTNARIYSFSQLCQQKLFPIFSSDMPLFILPQKI
ncbi:hypothetical protein WMY93_011430 [Mugilogobius chulae]|uniref:Uncharacterized protein n=1 Tax=Mugilogobius chulae TaxID=88201 RepID=A0AAW0PBJ7_9GOBI